MPYIKKDARQRLGAVGAYEPPRNAGELNYCLTFMVNDFLGDVPNYQKINEAIGVLECAKLEAYRRVAVPYEKEKIKENGDVYNK